MFRCNSSSKGGILYIPNEFCPLPPPFVHNQKWPSHKNPKKYSFQNNIPNYSHPIRDRNEQFDEVIFVFLLPKMPGYLPSFALPAANVPFPLCNPNTTNPSNPIHIWPNRRTE